jgi:hypothetical protein
MRRAAVAQLLEARLRLDAIVVNDLIVKSDALPFIRAGLICTVSLREQQFIGEVTSLSLLQSGQLHAAQAWLDAGGYASPGLELALRGYRLDAAQLAGVGYDDRCTILSIYRASGIPMDSPAAMLLETAPCDMPDPSGLAALHKMRAEPPAQSMDADEPIKTVDLDATPDIETFLWTGNLAECLQQLALAIERKSAAQEVSDVSTYWASLAEVALFFTGDEPTAMRLLERECFRYSANDWPRLFGPRGSARLLQEKSEVLATIEAAFDGIVFPGPAHRSLYQAEAEDNYRGCDQSEDHQGRWQDLPRKHMLDCQWALPFLGSVSLQYYLPAIMSFAVRESEDGLESGLVLWIFFSLEQLLLFKRGPSAHRMREKFHVFSLSQLAAVSRFAEYYLHSLSDRRQWKAVASGGEWPTL